MVSTESNSRTVAFHRTALLQSTEQDNSTVGVSVMQTKQIRQQHAMTKRDDFFFFRKFIPGIGTRLLINFGTKKPKRPQRIHKVDPIETPPTTNAAMTLSDRDYYENLNIYTQFGDLQPMQLFTLFREFRMVSEYSTCAFLPSLEKTLLMKNIKTD